MEVVNERVAGLVAAITAVPSWRRRGRFMHPDLKRRREELEILSDFNRQLTDRRQQNSS